MKLGFWPDGSAGMRIPRGCGLGRAGRGDRERQGDRESDGGGGERGGAGGTGRWVEKEARGLRESAGSVCKVDCGARLVVGVCMFMRGVLLNLMLMM